MWYVVFFVSDFAYNSLTTNFYSLNYSKAAVFAEILPKIAGILNKYTEISEKPRRKQGAGVWFGFKMCIKQVQFVLLLFAV